MAALELAAFRRVVYHQAVDVMLGCSQDKQRVDPNIQQFFEEDCSNLDPEARSWCRSTIYMLSRYSLRKPSGKEEKERG